MNRDTPPRLLVISHDASRTGAPYCVLHLLGWIKANTNFQVDILLRNPGPLISNFEEYGPVTVFRHRFSLSRLIRKSGLKKGTEEWLRGVFRNFKHSVKPYRSSTYKGLLRHLKKTKPQLIYSNTIVNGDILHMLSPLGLPVITHVHELKSIIDMFGPDNWNMVKSHTTRYIAASNAVKDNLVKSFSVESALIDIVYEFIPTNKFVLNSNSRDKLRKDLDLGVNEFVVCGSGLDEWRKGIDLFIRCAHETLKLATIPVKFVWVGGWLSDEARRTHLNLAEELGVRDHLLFTGLVDNPVDYFALANVFTLTSREDPFPLVCLEAATLGIPVICFAGAGGMPDFVETDAGFVVPFEAVDEMADRIFELSTNEALRAELGRRAQIKVAQRHDVAVGAPQVIKLIRSMV